MSKVEDTSLPVTSRKGFHVSTGSWAAVRESCKEVPSLASLTLQRKVLRQAEDSSTGSGVKQNDEDMFQSLGYGGRQR